MKSLSKKFKSEWEFFINPKTGKIQYNPKCNSCTHDCKQSFRAELINCPNYEKANKFKQGREGR